ncbi:TonB-dependent receptor plug domain-containing protein [Sphingomonas hankookensis]|uniref:TonB-dependent receptor plug domain-containing protein n=1 Tax=Sphingomonas hankookensis TaxID=563996 RepID=UPI003D3038E6
MALSLALILAQVAAPTAPEPVAPVQSAPADPQTPGEPRTDTGRLAPAQSGGEIVVTARRRAETVQQVPIAMSVIGGTTLADTGAYNVSRLTQLQPTLQFYSTNPRNSAANIRGLGAPFGLTNDGIEQGVGIYVDGVYYSRIASATFDFTDTERIEILRGPQGTLYGKNTTAGAINIATRRPSFTPKRASNSPPAITTSSRPRRRRPARSSATRWRRASPPRSRRGAARSATPRSAVMPMRRTIRACAGSCCGSRRRTSM